MNSLINRDNIAGLIANIIFAIGLAALTNALIFSLGWNITEQSTIQPSFNIPDYVVGIVWLFLFAFMGTSRWLVITSGSKKAIYHSRIVVLLIFFCFLYPFYSLAINSYIGGLIGNIATVILAFWTANEIKSSSKAASRLVFTVVLWTLFATAIVIRLIQLNGVNLHP